VSAAEQKLVQHHMLDIVDPRHSHTVVDFKSRALPIVERLLR
jgi:tRNA A37 N6-isopentenylltransferase MiaA